MDAKRKRNALGIHKQPHPYDRVRTVLFRQAVFAQVIFLCALEEVVDAIATQNAGVSGQ